LIKRDFKPDKNWKKLNYLHLIIGYVIWELIILIVILISIFWFIIFSLLFLIIFIPGMIWIHKFFDSVQFSLNEHFVKSIQGIWWKHSTTLPYNRITHADTTQGPIERLFGIGNVMIFTPSSGVYGSTLFGIKDAENIKDQISEEVRQAKMHTEPHGELKTKPMGEIQTKPTGELLRTQKEILDELRRIKKRLN